MRTATLALVAVLCACVIAEWKFERPPDGYYSVVGPPSRNGRPGLGKIYQSMPSSVLPFTESDCYFNSFGNRESAENCFLSLLDTDDDIVTNSPTDSSDPIYDGEVGGYGVQLIFTDALPGGVTQPDGAAHVYDYRSLWAADVKDESNAFSGRNTAVFMLGESRMKERDVEDVNSNNRQWLVWTVYHFRGGVDGLQPDHFSGTIDYPFSNNTARADTVAGPLVFDYDSIATGTIGDDPTHASMLVAGQTDTGLFWYAAPRIDSSTQTTSYMAGGSVTVTGETARPFGVVRASGAGADEGLAWVLCEEDNGLSVKHFSASGGSLVYEWTQQINGPAMRVGNCVDDPYLTNCDFRYDDLRPWKMSWGNWAETSDNIVVSMASSTHIWTVVLDKTTVAADIFSDNGDLQVDYELNSIMQSPRNSYYGGYYDDGFDSTPQAAYNDEYRLWADKLTTVVDASVQGQAHVVASMYSDSEDERYAWALTINFDSGVVVQDDLYGNFGNSNWIRALWASPFRVYIMGIPAPAIGGEAVAAQWVPGEVTPRLLAAPGIDRWAQSIEVMHMEYSTDELEPDWAYFFGIFVAATALHLAMGGIVFGVCACGARVGKKYEDDAWNLNDRLGMQYLSPKGLLMFCCTNPYRPAAESDGNELGGGAPAMVVTPAEDNGYVPPNAGKAGGKDGRRLSSRSNNSRNSRRSQNSKRSNRSARSKKSSNGGSSSKPRRSNGGKSGGKSSKGDAPPAYDDLSFVKK